MKRLLLLSFTAVILFGLSSCGDEKPNNGNNNDIETTAPALGDEDPSDMKFVADSLPELNYDGKTVNWFCGDYNDAYFGDIWTDAQNGSVVNDAIYATRRTVEERLNVTIEVNRYQFVYSQAAEFNTLIKSLIMAGDDTYDAFFGYTLVRLIVEGGYFMNLADNEYIELDKPWWNQNARELMPDDNVYFITGDATLSLIKHSLCMFFNQDLFDTYNITDDLYDVVRRGDWTLDYLEKLIADTYYDLNGNQVSDKDDRFGLTFGDTNKYRMLPAAMAVDMYTKTSDGYSLTFISERTNNVFTRLQNLVNNNENVRTAAADTSSNEVVDSFGGNKTSSIFISGNALFSASIVGDAATILENSTFTLGMLPFPKYDSNQDDYYTAAQRFAHIYIPSTVEDFDRAGAVIEAWASECYRSLMPTYFETNLKTRYSTDSNMAEMFDILRDNLQVEFGTVFFTMLGLNCDTFKSIDNSNYNFASSADALRISTETQLETLVQSLKGE